MWRWTVVRRPLPNTQLEGVTLMHTLLKLIFRRRHDEAIRRTMPWLVASGAIVPGSIYRRK